MALEKDGIVTAAMSDHVLSCWARCHRPRLPVV